jgi:uncharacterized protein YjbJ (UPF0337 family)
MDQNRFAGMWKHFRGKAEESWGKLIDDPQVTATGLRDQRAGKEQVHLAASRESAARQLREFYERNRNWNLSNH